MTNGSAKLLMLTIALVSMLPGNAEEIITAEQVASKLYFTVIGSASEDPDDLRKTYAACVCIAKKLRSDWEPDRFANFYRELETLQNQFYSLMKSVDMDLESKESFLQRGIPKPSEKLNRALEDIIHIVHKCEESSGAHLEW